MASKQAQIDVSTLSYAELNALLRSAQEQIAAKRDTELKALCDGFLQQLEAAGFTTVDAAVVLELPRVIKSNGPKSRKTAGKKSGGIVAAKYKGPNGETWSGRGKQPRWLAALVAEGHSVDEYAIK